MNVLGYSLLKKNIQEDILSDEKLSSSSYAIKYEAGYLVNKTLTKMQCNKCKKICQKYFIH